MSIPKLQSSTTKSFSAFQKHNQVQSERTVTLMRQAIARLEAERQKITLFTLVQATRAVDDQGKGLAVKTILRNASARELFHQHSLSYQQRQQQSKRQKRKRPRLNLDAETRTAYRGLRTSDLICMVEELKQRIAVLKNQESKLETERAEAYRLRDETLQQNTVQLATLTKMKEQLTLLDQSHRGKGEIVR